MKLICYLYIFFSCFFFISSITQINSKLRKKSKITETKINSIVTYITELARDNPNVFKEIKNNILISLSITSFAQTLPENDFQCNTNFYSQFLNSFPQFHDEIKTKIFPSEP